MGAAPGAAGASGTSGSDDGGAGGADHDDTQPPAVVSFTPEDGAANVERNVTVTIELSEPIDEASVTTSSVRLLVLDGDVAGTVKATKSTITFVPDVPLSLLETYTIALSDSIADLAGNTLADDASAEFRVRDGRWGTPTFPFGTEVARAVRALESNRWGDAVVGTNDSAAVYAARYEATQNRWTAAAVVPGAAGALWDAVIDDSRYAALAWCCRENESEWARLTGEDTWVAAGALGTVRQVVRMGVTPTGSAIAVWPVNTEPTTVIMNLANGTLAGPTPVHVPGDFYNFFPITSLNRIGLIAGKQFELAIVWKEGSIWSSPQTLASAGVEIGNVTTDSDELGNVVAAWRQGDELWARIYERARDQWTPGHRVGKTTSSVATVLQSDITAGNAIVAADGGSASEGVLAGIYRADSGWLESSVTLLDNHGDFGPIGLTIDRAGNGLALWSAELKFQRYVAADGWQGPGSLEASLQSSGVFSAGAPDGSVLMVTTDLTANPNGVPMAVRFE
jgi:hypothetical protein